MLPWAFMKMNRRLSVVFLVSLFLRLATSGRAGETTADAQKVTEAWLGLIDGGKLDDSWTQAHSMFREKVPQADWVKAISDLQGRVGKMKSRKLRVAQATKSLPGAPDGDYVVLIYDSSYENLPEAMDQLVAAKDKDGAWHVSGYSVRPAQKP